jgi:MoaA/NifB/PqqE/SkfB family radical SAM enzyme
LTEADYAKQYPGTDPNNFHKVLQGLHQLHLEKQRRNSRLPSLVLHHPINRHNMQRIEAIGDLAAQAGCSGVSLSPFLSLQGRNDALLLSHEEQAQLIVRLRAFKRFLRGRGLTENIDTVLKRYAFVPLHRKTAACYAGWYHARVRVDGTFVPCGACDTVLGHAGSQSFEEIWNGPAYQQFRAQTRTYEGLRDLSAKEGDCSYCCYAPDNLRIERWVGGWLQQWWRARGSPTAGIEQHPGPSNT